MPWHAEFGNRIAARLITYLYGPWLSGFRSHLSFAKNASADMSLRGNAFITVMQTAGLRDLDDRADTRDLSRNRTLLVEAQMGPRSVVQPVNSTPIILNRAIDV
jgi:hypothetical protein